ncbi:hypothetical protein AVEN_212456-1 [Araneus ventricosus]|uniref:Uncharacterized protein n=1 Tax=Araneus ventricosus TaxID=182803 RepID=A0A4Y2JCP2_ARAVE|nr:hypothetical protein AVEN_212456-1 [Araneus ventricosus]
MNLSRAVGYIIRNEQRRTERSQEIVKESTVRRSIRNEADNRRRPKRVCIRNDVEEHTCGTMSEQCGFCGAVYWKEEKNTAYKYTKCCHDGKVQLPAFPLTENSPDAKNYRQCHFIFCMTHAQYVFHYISKTINITDLVLGYMDGPWDHRSTSIFQLYLCACAVHFSLYIESPK